MSKSYVFEGKTSTEAIEKGLKELKVKKNDVDIKIIEETLWSKMANSTVNKVNIFDYDNLKPVRIRDHTAEYLSDDVSIMIAVNRQTNNHTSFIELSGITNINILIPFLGTVPTEIINLLDNTIEKISVETINDNPVTKLKFLNRDELLLSNPNELNYYLSSGTIRGIRFFTDAIRILKEGGYLTIDEIENHFNRELVASLLRLFIDKRTNPNGSVIIFSTHYAEILDEIVRNDAIFITRNDFGLTIDNLSTLLNRNDMKKSEVYQSNYVGGTAPKYSALNALQKSIIN